jgi:hypothetical protein
LLVYLSVNLMTNLRMFMQLFSIINELN